MDQPLVLFFAADPEPGAYAPVTFDQEARAIERSMERGAAHERLRLRPRLAATKSDLIETLAASRDTRIVHFAMHGSGHGLRFADELGRADLLSPEALEAALRAAPEVELVVFNVCKGEALAQACKGSIPCAIGARGKIEAVVRTVHALEPRSGSAEPDPGDPGDFGEPGRLRTA